MSTTILETRSVQHIQKEITQPRWQRITLLSILGYEGAGGLVGGALLVAAPDGRYMDMPVDIMHGAFRDFLIPGILLIGDQPDPSPFRLGLTRYRRLLRSRRLFGYRGPAGLVRRRFGRCRGSLRRRLGDVRDDRRSLPLRPW